ncbi:MAG TPA: folate-binding protein [Casimicrobiaceae bacterium]|nr:folate-binding protein [Casimicrobiaceae bacterium]
MTLVTEATVPSEEAWRAARERAVVTRVADLALLTIDGEDAPGFLQGQLSNDVNALSSGAGHWTSYNSPKGRMLATLYLTRRNETSFAALLASDLVATIAQRLTMFVLRSKVRVAASPNTCLVGLGGPAAKDALQSAFGLAPVAGIASVDSMAIVGLPDGRRLVVSSCDAAPDLFATLAAHAMPVGDDVWSWLGVASGVPMVTAATQDLFVAQTANWDAIGGLDFRKGCYPGQEIVARMQYLGRLKERLFMFASEASAPSPATRLFSEAFGDQPCGTVVNSSPAPTGGSVMLAVAQQGAVERGPLTIGAQDGAIATREPLPYPLPAAAAPRERI